MRVRGVRGVVRRRCARSGLQAVALIALAAGAFASIAQAASGQDGTLAGKAAQAEAKAVPPTPEQAATAAWRAGYSDALEQRLRALAATGQPRDLLVAGVMWPAVRGLRTQAVPAETDVDPSTGWFAAAAAAPRDPLVDWLAASGCRRAWEGCEREEAVASLLQARPDDLTVQLLALAAALDRGDGVMAQEYLQAAAAATGYWQPTLELGSLMLDAMAPLRPQAPSKDVARALGAQYRLHRAATVADQNGMTVIGIGASLPMPAYAALGRMCVSALGVPEEHLAACRKVLERVAGSPVLAARMLGTMRAVLLAGDGPDAAAARERLRQVAWLHESGQRRLADTDGAPVPAEYRTLFVREGDVAALSLLLESGGVPLQAPAGWLPGNPRLRSLVVDGREPAPSAAPAPAQ